MRWRQLATSLLLLVWSLATEATDTAQLKLLGLRPCSVADGSEVIPGLVRPLYGGNTSVPARQSDQHYCDPDLAADRYGVPIVQIVRAGQWLQTAQVRRGERLVFSARGEARGLAYLLGLEAKAREEKRGLWASSESVLNTDQVRVDKPYFVIVTGCALAAGAGRYWRYLNFGQDWKTDFTVRMSSDSARRLQLDFDSLAGARVEVRGEVGNRNGPMITLTLPGQIRRTEGRCPP